MKKIKPEYSNIQVKSNNFRGIQNVDAMKAFKKKFSANVMILSYLRGDQGFEESVPFEPLAHIIEG